MSIFTTIRVHCLLTFEEWVVCVIVVFALPPGDAYNFVINVVRTSCASRPPTAHPSSHTDLIPISSHKRYHLIWAHLPFTILSGLFVTYTTSDPRPPDTRPLLWAHQCFFGRRADDSASGGRATI